MDIESVDDVSEEQERLGYGADRVPLPSEQLIDIVREMAGDTLLLSFSCGKDSIAMWLYLRDHFEIIPYFLYWVPGLDFVEEGVRYYEEFFDTEILRLPHPLFYKMLNGFNYQPPERVALIRALNLPNFDFADVDNILADYFGLDNPFCAIGMRAKDNIDRRNMILQRGAIGVGRRRYYYPIWDWDVMQVARIIRDAGVQLPIEYKYWGRTLAAYDYQYLAPLKEHFPSDYQKYQQWFPLIDLEIFRYEQVGKHGEDQN